MENIQELYSSIAHESEVMVARDQEMRKKWQETKVWDAAIDEQNTKRAKDIIVQIGYPTISKIGEKASHLFWFLIQHADRDIEFQKECLQIMKNLPKEEVRQDDIGYLEDRVRGAESKPQLYGTQFWTNPETGEYEVKPIEDREQLDERRAALSMMPFSEYENIMMEKFGPKKETR